MQSLGSTLSVLLAWPGGETYELTRLLFRRSLAVLYLLAFLVAARQFRPLAGEDGLLPIERYVDSVRFRERPSLFYFLPDDRAIGAAAWLGVALAALAVLGLPARFGTVATVLVWAGMWVLYQSFVNAGQLFYGYGWESMLLETGFL
ncbi:MAG: lipase maturation factor family protein, partial [Haloarculaceae archaeon]